MKFRAAGLNSEGYSGERDQGLPRGFRFFVAQTLGGRQAMPLRSSAQDGVGFAFYIALVCWASQARHQPIALAGWR